MHVYDYSGLKGKSCWKKTLISPALHAELHATSIGPRSNYVYRHVEGYVGKTTNGPVDVWQKHPVLLVWNLLSRPLISVAPSRTRLGVCRVIFCWERSDLFEVHSDCRRRKTPKKRGRRGSSFELDRFKTRHMDIHESWTAACSCCHYCCHAVRPSLRKRGGHPCERDAHCSFDLLQTD